MGISLNAISSEKVIDPSLQSKLIYCKVVDVKFVDDEWKSEKWVELDNGITCLIPWYGSSFVQGQAVECQISEDGRTLFLKTFDRQRKRLEELTLYSVSPLANGRCLYIHS